MNKNTSRKSPTKSLPRSRVSGRFIRRAKLRKVKNVELSIRNGRLYSYQGQVVRAIQLCSNGLRLVGSGGRLFGFVDDKFLTKASL